MSMQTLMMEHDPGQFHSLSAILSSCRGPSDGFDMDAHHHILHKGPGMPEPSNQQVLMTQRILTSLSMVPHVGLVLMRRVSLFLLQMDVWWLSLRMVESRLATHLMRLETRCPSHTPWQRPWARNPQMCARRASCSECARTAGRKLPSSTWRKQMALWSPGRCIPLSPPPRT